MFSNLSCSLTFHALYTFMLSKLSERFDRSSQKKRSISLSTGKLVEETSQFMKGNSYQSAPENLPDIILLLVGGGADG